MRTSSRALQDCVSGALRFDDAQIVEWHVFAERGPAAGFVALLEVRA